jgi:hypothetical protein
MVSKSNSRKSQLLRLSQCLQEKRSVTTLYAREVLNIMAPAARVMDLRSMGYDILTQQIEVVDGAGVSHPKVARYVLISIPEGTPV